MAIPTSGNISIKTAAGSSRSIDTAVTSTSSGSLVTLSSNSIEHTGGRATITNDTNTAPYSMLEFSGYQHEIAFPTTGRYQMSRTDQSGYSVYGGSSVTAGEPNARALILFALYNHPNQNAVYLLAKRGWWDAGDDDAYGLMSQGYYLNGNTAGTRTTGSTTIDGFSNQTNPGGTGWQTLWYISTQVDSGIEPDAFKVNWSHTSAGAGGGGGIQGLSSGWGSSFTYAAADNSWRTLGNGESMGWLIQATCFAACYNSNTKHIYGTFEIDARKSGYTDTRVVNYDAHMQATAISNNCQ